MVGKVNKGFDLRGQGVSRPNAGSSRNQYAQMRMKEDTMRTDVCKTVELGELVEAV